MVVLSIIGGAAFMFNTAMLKGNMMIPVSDTSSGVSSGISSGLSSGISGDFSSRSYTLSTMPTTYDIEVPAATIRKVATNGTAKLTVSQYEEDSDLEIDWDSGETTYTLGKWSLATDDDIGIYIPDDSAQFYIGPTVAKTSLSSYFTDIKTNIAFGDLETDNMYELTDTSWMYLISDYDYVFTVTGIPIASKATDFANIKVAGPEVALTFSSIWAGSTDLANSPDNSQSKELTYTSNPIAFSYDETKGYSFGGYSLISTATEEPAAIVDDGTTEETEVDAILTTTETGSGDTEIDWNTTDEYSLGKFEVTSTRDVTITTGDLSLSMQDTTANLSSYFDELTLKVSAVQYPDAEYLISDDEAITLSANTIYTFEITGIPKSKMSTSFSSYNGEEMRMTIESMQLTKTKTYDQSDDIAREYFSADEYDETNKEYYSNGGYTLSSAAEVEEVATDTYSNIITVTDENGSAVTTITENDFSISMSKTTISAFDDTLSADGIYAVTLTDGSSSSYTLIVSPDGYVVDGLPYNEGYGSVTIYDDQVDYSASVELDHGYSIFPVDSSGAAISDADITITDGTCTEYPATGGYYCLVSTTGSAPTYTIIADGFENFSKTFDSYRLYPVSTTITESPELTAGTSEPVEEAPDTEVTEVTGGLEFAFKELVSGIGLTAKLSTEDLHFYSSADSSTEIEATVELISAPKGKTTIGATLPEGEYNVTVSPEGYVSQELGSYTTAENVFLAVANIEKLEYGYYVHILNDANTSTVIANTVVECDSLGDGYYGCAIPLSVSIPNFTVSNSEYADYSASFITARDEADDPSETAEMNLGDSSPLTGDDWVIAMTVTNSIGQVVEGLTESNFDLGDQTLTAVEDLLDGNYYLYVENEDSYSIDIIATGYVTNSNTYNSVSFADYIVDTTNISTEVTLEFTHYLRLLDSIGEIITGGTITAGDGSAVSCLDFSTLTTDYDGFYACGIPSTDTSTLFNVSATGYDDYEGDFATEGTLDAEGYVTVDVTLTTTTGETSTETTVEETATEVDADGDTYTSANDCDDTDATVYDYQTYYLDADSDGYGDASTYVSQCTMTAPTGYVTNSTDDSDVVEETTSEEATVEEEVATETEETDSSSADTTDTSTSDDDSDDTSSSASATKSEILSDPDYVCTSPFYDIIGHWGSDSICRLYKAGIVSGKTATTFAPNDYITRAEFLKIALGNAGYTIEDATGLSETMLDVSDSDWYSPWIKIAENAGFLGNGNVNWYPNASGYRKDLVVIAVRIAKQTLYGFTQSDINFSDVFVSDYFAYAVIIMNNTTVEGTPIISGYTNGIFGGSYHMTRAEVSSMIKLAHLAWY